MYERERGLARVDSLTGVANRLQLADTLQREMRRHARTHRPFCIAYIDCDVFMAINDRLGHLEGDRLLRVAAQTISRHVRGGDFVARVGGDEFVVLFADAEGSALAGTLAGLRQALRERFTTEGWNVTFSIGLVTFRSMPASAEDALACADRAMYEAKSQGRDRVVQRQYVASA
jgi:diguanylate cyclase (GGDEF)-like protein